VGACVSLLIALVISIFTAQGEEIYREEKLGCVRQREAKYFVFEFL
jgi:hypothetical protein